MRFFDRVMSQRGASSLPRSAFFFSPGAVLKPRERPERLSHRSNKRARFFATRGDVGDL
jgi:hypothetical protein